MLDRKFFAKLREDVIPMYRRHIWIDEKDANDVKFPKYSSAYGIAKRGRKLKGSAKKWANSKAPALSGLLHNSFGLIETRPDGFKFGTTVYGARVKNLEKMGRLLSTKKQPLPKKIQKFIIKEADNYFMKGMKKNFKDKKINLNL